MNFIDIHTHSNSFSKNTIRIRNYFPGEKVNDGFFSIGIHPWYIDLNSVVADLAQIEKTVCHSNCLAIGECGLDKLADENFALQEDVFIKQIELSEKYKKPLIIHCVRAFQEIIAIKQRMKPKQPWIFHGFQKRKTLAEQLIQNDCFLSFGNALISNKKLQSTFKELPINSIFLETDNAEVQIEDIYEIASTIKSISKQKLQSQIQQNFINIF